MSIHKKYVHDNIKEPINKVNLALTIRRLRILRKLQYYKPRFVKTFSHLLVTIKKQKTLNILHFVQKWKTIHSLRKILFSLHYFKIISQTVTQKSS